MFSPTSVPSQPALNRGILALLLVIGATRATNTYLDSPNNAVTLATKRSFVEALYSIMDSPVDLKGSEREHFKSELLWYLTDSRITPLLFLTTASATELLQHTNGCICQLRLFIQLYRTKATTQPQHSRKYMECFNNNIEAWRASVTYCQMRRDDNVKFLRNCIGPRPSELVDEGKRWFPFGVRLDSTYCTALALHHYPNHQMPAGHHSLGWSSTPAPWAMTSACKSAVGFPNCWMPEWVACPNKPKATNWSCSIS